MTPRERLLIRRLMVLASVLVSLMVAATLWLALQDVGRGPQPRPPGPDSSSGPPAGSP
jgi:hypothetical protein